MSIIICKNCGRKTNTTTCDHINNRDQPHRADKCYLAIEGLIWVKGCSYDQADIFHKQFCDKLLAMNCAICQRFTPDHYKEKHHLVPKVKGGKETVVVCMDCGNQIHKLFTNPQLKNEYNTVEKLLADERVQKWAKWVSKKIEFGCVCMKEKK